MLAIQDSTESWEGVFLSAKTALNGEAEMGPETKKRFYQFAGLIGFIGVVLGIIVDRTVDFDSLKMTLFIVALTGVGFWVYMLPLTIAYTRNYGGYFLILLALVIIGPTGLGWLALLVWSLGYFDGIFASVKGRLGDEK